MKNCCAKTSKKTKQCIRGDGKVFQLPRRFTRVKCIKGPVRGFSMRSSCAPYKFCKSKIRQEGGGRITRKKQKQKKQRSKMQFLYNPDDPKRSFDVYIDKNPADTIPIKYKTVEDVKATIEKLERLYKAGKYPHKRIWQVGMIMYVRLKVLKDKKPKEYKLSERYFKFLGKRTKVKGESERKQLKFK